jgi:hypothetical protein
MSNSTFDPADCTLATCSVKEYGQIQYIPNLAGNIAYLAIFGALTAAQIFLGVRFKTWGYLVGMICGGILEIVGYVGRLMLNNNIFDNNAFIIYLVGLTIAPAFYTASIYLCLGRIITVHSIDLSMLKPKWVTVIFVCCDFFSLVLQGAGGGIAATADDDDKSGKDLGINLMIAGLATQVASLAVFSAICSQFAWRVRKNPTRLNPEFATLRNSRRFKGLLFGMCLPLCLPQVISLTFPPSHCSLLFDHHHSIHLSSRRAVRWI